MARQDSFQQKKNAILAEISSEDPDRSPIGSIDSDCLPIIELINSHPDLVTTSSCSGRLSVFVEGCKLHQGHAKTGGKGDGGIWLYVSHDASKIGNWFRDNISSHLMVDYNSFQMDNSIRLILFKYEPFILHVKCRNFEVASKLYNTAMACGFRESGIGSNNIVGIRINIKLDVPLGYLDERTNKHVFFVNESYIRMLDQLTIMKFEENKTKMNQLFSKIKSDIIEAPSTPKIPHETKEQRRERKRQEGLARQQQLKDSTNISD